MPEVALVLLAAGAARRMGRPKQLLEFDGEPLIRRSARAALASACRPVVVVLGAEAASIRPALDGLPVRIRVNERWNEGVGTSIQAGLAALGDLPITGLVLALADLPGITAATYDGLLAFQRARQVPLVASAYSDTVGVPAYFGRELFPELLALGPDMGCKGVLLRRGSDLVTRECPEAAVDVDTPDDYARWQAGEVGRRP